MNNLIQDQQTELFKKLGVFFAFGQSQFDERAIKCVDYTSCGAGMICPKVNVKELALSLKNIHKAGRERDLKENGKSKIIQRELANYECQITGDVSDCFEAVKDYGITLDEVKKEYSIFYKWCVENDNF